MCVSAVRGQRLPQSVRSGAALGFDRRPWLQAILPRRDDLFAGCHAVIDDGNAVADFQGPASTVLSGLTT